jgi:multiple sugar transport system permease protein
MRKREVDGDASILCCRRLESVSAKHIAPLRHWLWLRTTVFHLLAFCVTLVFLLPLVWVLASSLRQPGLPPPRAIEWIPSPVVWSNYQAIFELVPLAGYLFNSLFITALAIPLTIIVASLAGFAMAQLPAPVRYVLLVFAIVLRMVPVTALWLPRFVVFVQLDLIDTYWALLAPVWMGSSPLFVLLFYWSFRRMPSALFESAWLEGMGAWRIWAEIGLAHARPAIVAVSVLTFAQYWNDFINPLLYLKSESRYTLAVGLRVLQQLDATNWPLLMAGAAVMTLPVVLLFILIQRAFWLELER